MKFVALSLGLFLSVMLSHAQQVSLRGNLTMTSRTAVDAAGSLAYTVGPNNFAIVDLANPDVPVLRGQVTPNAPQLTGVDVLGNYAYCAGQNQGLVVIRVQNPATPQWLVNQPLASAARDVAAFDTLVAVATATNVTLIGVRNPSDPNILATYPRASSWIEYEPATGRLHVGTTTGAYALNVNATIGGGDTTYTLQLYDQFDTQSLTPLAIGGGYVNAVRDASVRVINSSTYNLVGQYTSTANIQAIASAPGYSFIGLATGIVQYLSQQGANPTFLDGATVAGQVYGLALASSGNQPLVVAAHATGLAVLDYDPLAADPELPPVVPQEIALSAYPNPFNGTVTLTLSAPQHGPYYLTVIDNLGREILRERLYVSGVMTHQLDLSNCAAGHYLARLSGKTGAASLRLIYLP